MLCLIMEVGHLNALPKANIASENRLFQKKTSIPTIHFQVLG